MSQIPEQVVRELRSLSDEELASVDETRLRAIRQAAGRHGGQGFALACPSRLTGFSIPLLVLHMRDARRAAQVVGSANEVVLASPLGRGLTAVAALHKPRPDKRPMVDAQGRPKGPIAPSPDDPNPPRITGATMEDVGERLKLPDAGRYALRVLSWDWVSNAVVTTLDRADEDDPPVDLRWSLDDALAVHAPLEAWRRYGAALPTAVRVGASPAVEGEGLALSLPPRWSVGASSVPVYGSLRAALPPEAAVVPAWRVAPPEGSVAPDPDTLPRALFPATLLLVRLGRLTPVRLDFTLPIYHYAALQAGAVVEGWFGLDLATVDKASLPPGEYCAYLVVGEHLAGPHHVEVTG